MKAKIILAILALFLITGCTPGSVENSTGDASVNSSDDEHDGGSTGSTTVSLHNQGRACLDCHGPGDEESFLSGGTVYTVLNGNASSEYANGYIIRLVLENTQSISYGSGRGTGNSRTSDSRLTSSYAFTAQVVDSSGNVVNASAVNSHDYTRLDCNRCHTSTGNSGAPGRIAASSTASTGGATGDTGGTTTTGVTFVDSVMPLLVSYCQGCHGNNGNFSVTTAATTYSNITANGFVDTANVDNSRLLTKATGTGHGGGTILLPTGTVYQTLREWITLGALNTSGGSGGTTGGTTGGTVSFSASVMPLITSNCKTCHGNSGRFTVTTAAATYTNIMSNSFADTASVNTSLLLTKASGTNHGGGTILPASGAGYQTLRDWIAQGALNN